MEKSRFERIAVGRPGEEVLRRRVRSHTQLRFRPGIPGLVHFARVILTETPLVLMLAIVVLLTAIVAALLFAVERNANEHVDTYLDTVWWAMSSIQTQGNTWRPETFWGSVIGGAWTVIGTVLFWGAIIASVTVFFLRRRERTEREIISTIKGNLDDLENLSLQELELLKESADNVINLQIQQAKARSQPHR
ncbi:MAG: two pore domain potassium channel family protein [Dehalococcoidia bacterium]